ncbi:hypothetical protein HBB16_08155 [Pseudonocardia sp. MCCB 268]|nr:hypothetical protein [Pseudonocardia cytotoxica]
MVEGTDSADDLANRRDFFNTGLTKAAPLEFGIAGLTPADVDVALVNDFASPSR